MTDTTTQAVTALLDGATQGRRVQFHPSYCPEAVGTPFSDWDTSHDMSVILTDGKRYKLATYRHSADAALSQAAPDLVRALLAERDAAEARARESALDALAAYSQAADAHTAQLAAEERLEAMQVVLELTAQAGSFNARTAENAKARVAELEAMLTRAYEAGRDDAAGAAEKRYDQCERVVGPCQLRKCAIARFLRDLPVPSPADLADRVKGGEV